jgi:hypothetical protein
LPNSQPRVLVFQKAADEGVGGHDDRRKSRSTAPALKGNYLISIDYLEVLAFGFYCIRL